MSVASLCPHRGGERGGGERGRPRGAAEGGRAVPASRGVRRRGGRGSRARGAARLAKASGFAGLYFRAPREGGREGAGEARGEGRAGPAGWVRQGGGGGRRRLGLRWGGRGPAALCAARVCCRPSRGGPTVIRASLGSERAARPEPPAGDVPAVALLSAAPRAARSRRRALSPLLNPALCYDCGVILTVAVCGRVRVAVAGSAPV